MGLLLNDSTLTVGNQNFKTPYGRIIRLDGDVFQDNNYICTKQFSRFDYENRI